MAISFDEAIIIAKRRNSRFNKCVEHSNAWAFCCDDGVESVGGPDTGIVVMKEDGRKLLPYEYYFSDIGDGIIINEIRI